MRFFNSTFSLLALSLFLFIGPSAQVMAVNKYFYLPESEFDSVLAKTELFKPVQILFDGTKQVLEDYFEIEIIDGTDNKVLMETLLKWREVYTTNLGRFPDEAEAKEIYKASSWDSIYQFIQMTASDANFYNKYIIVKYNKEVRAVGIATEISGGLDIAARLNHPDNLLPPVARQIVAGVRTVITNSGKSVTRGAIEYAKTSGQIKNVSSYATTDRSVASYKALGFREGRAGECY